MKRRRLGQHYLSDPAVAEKLVSASEAGPGDAVLEIGTGRGELTAMLCERAKSVEAYEVDRENAEVTSRNVRSRNLTLRVADAFESRPSFDVLVSSVPYSRSSDFVEWLAQLQFKKAAVLLQKDFVDKLAARPGDRNYRAVSAIGQMAFRIAVRHRVPREAFEPAPKVDSAIVVLTPRARLTREEISRLKELFALRRKTVRAAGVGGRALASFGQRRIYTLGPEELETILEEARR
jgi:16S rRNA (adenine1518-N6/adenine1519-N6)-dimethyltransferase